MRQRRVSRVGPLTAASPAAVFAVFSHRQDYANTKALAEKFWRMLPVEEQRRARRAARVIVAAAMRRKARVRHG